MTDTPTITLNDGHHMPQIGQGVFQVPAEDAAGLVETGISAGYRAIDTARIYKNEAGVGDGVRAADETVFVTTKLWNEDQGRDAAFAAFDASFERLGLEWVDLYLIHWPVPSKKLYVETWKALIELRDGERLRSIGVSNFTIAQLREIIDATGVVPVTNQIELHPGFAQNDLVAFHEEHGIATTSWSPLGQGKLLDDPVIAEIARKHGRSPAQVIVRWHIERGLIVIPKASSKARLSENLAAREFALDADDMAAIAGLDSAGGRIGPEPDSM